LFQSTFTRSSSVAPPIHLFKSKLHKINPSGSSQMPQSYVKNQIPF